MGAADVPLIIQCQGKNCGVVSRKERSLPAVANFLRNWFTGWMPRLKTLTLGCKVNQYETELVREGFSRIGFEDARENESADLCLVNTCTVTNEGDVKSRRMIRKLARENPHARIIVMGCYATRARQELA